MQITVEKINRVTGVAGNVKSTEGGDQLVALRASDYEEVTRPGRAFYCKTATANNTASVIAVGTTTAGLGLCNTADDGGRSMIIDAIWAIKILQAAGLSQEFLVCYLGQTREAAMAADLPIERANGLGTTEDSVAHGTDGGAILATGTALQWMPAPGSKHQMGTVTNIVGTTLWANVAGRLIIPPGRQFGVDVLSSEDATGTWVIGASWHEKNIKLY